MASNKQNPCNALERLFHEPSRLAIMSALGGAVEGLTFNDLKDQCRLTDGNLSRHLKTLEEAGAVRMRKRFVNAKPRTTVFLTDQGRADFFDYLRILEEVLASASAAMVPEHSTAHFFRNLQDVAEAS